MKIEIIKYRELAGDRKVRPGRILASPKDGPEELLQAYVNNGIARLVAPAASKKEVTTDGP